MITEHGLGRRTPAGVVVVYSILIIFTIWTLFPVVWAAITSFKQPGDSFKATFIPVFSDNPEQELSDIHTPHIPQAFSGSLRILPNGSRSARRHSRIECLPWIFFDVVGQLPRNPKYGRSAETGLRLR